MPRNKQLFAAFAIFVIMLVFTGCFLRLAYGAERTERTRMDSSAVSKYVAWFHRNVKKSRLTKAEAVLPYVLKYSEQYDLDPLLVACLISWETSWRPRPGGLGEIGYLQIMPRWFPKDLDRNTPDGQIHAGVRRLAKAFEKCGTTKRALTHYASGGCTSKSERTQKKIRFRVSYYAKMSERFRGGTR